MMGENISNIRKGNTEAAIIIPKQKHANKVNKDVKKGVGEKTTVSNEFSTKP